MWDPRARLAAVLERITGVLVHREPEAVVVEVGGLGMLVTVTAHTADALPEGEVVTLLTQLLFVGSQEPQPRLFGFRHRESRELFNLLRSVSGIGPSVAMRIVGAQPSPGMVAGSIARGEAKAIKVKGVGPKLTKRIISELRDKVAPLITSGTPQPVLTASGSLRRPARPAQADPAFEDAYLALRGMELEANRARSLLEEVREELDEASAEELIRAVLLRS